MVRLTMIEDTHGPLRILVSNMKRSGSVSSESEYGFDDAEYGEGDDVEEGEEDGDGGAKNGLTESGTVRGVSMESETLIGEKDMSVAVTNFVTAGCMDVVPEKLDLE